MVSFARTGDWLWNCIGRLDSRCCGCKDSTSTAREGRRSDGDRMTAGAETPLELFKIGPQSPRKLGNEDVPYRISYDGL